MDNDEQHKQRQALARHLFGPPLEQPTTAEGLASRLFGPEFVAVETDEDDDGQSRKSAYVPGEGTGGGHLHVEPTLSDLAADLFG